MALTIGELATLGGVSADTIRYYEREGLLPPPARSGNGYRLYEPRIEERLLFIRGAQRMGLRLREVRELLEVIDRGLCPCGHAENLVQRRIAEVEAEITRLASMRTALEHLAERFPAASCPDPQGGRWACEREFIQAGGGES